MNQIIRTKSQTKREQTADIFPVKYEFTLRAFEIDTNSSISQTKLLNQLTYQLGRKTNSSWCRTDDILITDLQGELPQNILEILWQDPQNRFGNVISIRELRTWQKQAKHDADMANTKFKQLEYHLKDKLESKQFGDAIVSRKCRSQSMVVDGIACLALSISSPIDYTLNLDELKKKKPELKIKGIEVKDRATKWSVGTITEVIGNLDSETKSRLLSLTTKEKQRRWIEQSSEYTNVVKVKTKNGDFLDYISTGLVPVPTYGALKEFGLNQNQISNFQRISSQKRRELIRSLISSTRLKRLLGDPLDSTNSNCFRTASDLGYDGMVLFGGGRLGHVSQNIRSLKNHGFYRNHESFDENQTVNICVLNGVKNLEVEKFISALKKEIDQFGFVCNIVQNQSCDANDFAALEETIEKLMNSNPDMIFSILPNRYFNAFDEHQGPYQDTKHLTINRGTMNQVVSEKTVHDYRFRLANIAVQMLAKVGNIPWVLPKELEFCDRILGADISRKKKGNGRGTRNEIGIPRWYESNGDLLNYRLTNTSIDGERIPMRIIREITPYESFKKTRILFHGDGKRPRSEIVDFVSRGNELDGEVMVVEVIKTSPSRLYSITNQTENPQKGDWFRISNSEAIVTSTTAQHSTGTPHPLLIRCSDNISIEQAVLSVLKLSDLHYGSKQQPRCPITTHDAHHIGKMLIQGIRPPADEGTLPWWL